MFVQHLALLLTNDKVSAAKLAVDLLLTAELGISE